MNGRSLVDPFTSAMQQAKPDTILDDLAAAKVRGARIVVNLAVAYSMTGAEILQYGGAFLAEPSSCAFLMWDSRASVIQRSDVASALAELAGDARAHAATSCRY